MVLAPLLRLALMDQKITPALVSFDSLSGIKSLFGQSLSSVFQLTIRIEKFHLRGAERCLVCA
jgi:hypothetical protein